MGAAAGLIEGENGGVVYVWGNATFSWDPGDVAARRFAAVQLVITKTARPSQVAGAFGVGTTTLWSWQCDFATKGLHGLLGLKRGPKGQRVLGEDGAERVKILREQGKSLREIASVLGCSTSPVRQVLGLIGSKEGRLGTSTKKDTTVSSDAEGSEGDIEHDGAEDGASHDEVEMARLPVSTLLGEPGLAPVPLPVPRIAERVFARFGLISEAQPVFAEGAGLARLGTLLILPAIDATGLVDTAKEVYRRLTDGFYGLTSVLLTMVFLAVL